MRKRSQQVWTPPTPPPGLARGTAFSLSTGSAQLPFSSDRTTPNPFPGTSVFPNIHPCIQHCVIFAWVTGLEWYENPPAMEEVNHWKTKPDNHSSHCLKGGVTNWTWSRDDGRGPPHCLGKVRRPYERTVSNRPPEAQERSPGEVHQHSEGGQGSDGTGPTFGEWHMVLSW